MPDVLGKKRYNIDQPVTNPHVSKAGSGIEVLLRDNSFGNPSFNLCEFNWWLEIFNNTPQFNAPVCAWT